MGICGRSVIISLFTSGSSPGSLFLPLVVSQVSRDENVFVLMQVFQFGGI